MFSYKPNINSKKATGGKKKKHPKTSQTMGPELDVYLY